jgi:glycosyltransferase involved in cell wall biosynthesis
MLASTQVAAVIPCFNEEAHIGDVVAGVKKYVSTVVVVDDGSTDKTIARAREAGAVVVAHGVNQGKGVALRSGFTQAQSLGFSWAIMMDGDGQHAPEDIPKLLSSTGGVEMVAGNRMQDIQTMPQVRRWVNRWMSRRISRLVDRDFPDTQCGFRLLNLAAWSRCQHGVERFEVESALLLEFVRAGFGIVFVPVQTIYKTEQSKIHPVRDTWRWLKWYRKARHESKRQKLRGLVTSPAPDLPVGVPSK